MLSGSSAYFSEFAKASRSIVLSSEQISCALDTFLSLTDTEFSDRIKRTMSLNFENELKAFCCVRDALVLSTFSDSFEDKTHIKAYADHLAETEEDRDIRQLRVNLFNTIACLH